VIVRIVSFSTGALVARASPFYVGNIEKISGFINYNDPGYIPVGTDPTTGEGLPFSITHIAFSVLLATYRYFRREKRSDPLVRAKGKIICRCTDIISITLSVSVSITATVSLFAQATYNLPWSGLKAIPRDAGLLPLSRFERFYQDQ
jgi:hypothetical protein